MVNKFSLEYDKGRFRKWLHFDGVDDYVNCGKIQQVSSELTIVALVKLQRKTGSCIFIRDPGASSYKYILYNDPVRFYVRTASGVSSTRKDESIYDNEIHLVSGVYDRYATYRLKLYIDKDLKQQAAGYDEDILEQIGNAYIGISYGGVSSSSKIQGDVYFLALYNRALSDEEIKELYLYVKYGVGKMIKDGLVLWLDGSSIDIENQVWKDKSSNGNDGTIYGATLQSGWVEG